MKVTLRKAEVSEKAFLQNFAKEVIDKNYREFLGDESVDFFIGSGASDQYVEDNIDETVVAVIQNKIVGMCVCKENLIDLIMIQSELHNQGIGSDFINMISVELLKRYSRIRVECFAKNVKANTFYLKNGWKQEKIEFDSEIGDNRVYYTKIAANAELLRNLEKLHTTELGIVRIKRNLSLDTDEVVAWCKAKIESPGAVITRNGKNWYVNIDGCIITVNAYSYTIITAHKER